jgi:hypothetical protein
MISLLLATVLVLKSGERIPVDRIVQRTPQRIVFESQRALYSLPAAEVATVAEETTVVPKDASKKLKVSPEERARLLKELAQNHSGTGAPLPPSLKELPPPAAPENAASVHDEEWRWRRESRAHEQAVREAKENLELLATRIDRLRGEIAGLTALGYHPRQFTYQTTALQAALEQIPYAQLDVQRAERALAEFREDARKQGVLPGWLR